MERYLSLFYHLITAHQKENILIFFFMSQKLYDSFLLKVENIDNQKVGFAGSNALFSDGVSEKNVIMYAAYLLPEWAGLPGSCTDVTCSIDIRKGCVHMIIYSKATVFS